MLGVWPVGSEGVARGARSGVARWADHRSSKLVP
jgi:hypothetical protein